MQPPKSSHFANRAGERHHTLGERLFWIAVGLLLFTWVFFVGGAR